MREDQLKHSMNKTWQRILLSAVFCWMIIELIDLIIPICIHSETKKERAAHAQL